MKTKLLVVLTWLLVSCLMVTQASAYTYSLDDGTIDNEIGRDDDLAHLQTWAWMNQFNAVPGSEKIVSIEVVWGNIPVNYPYPITVKLWGDPNNDGVPDDRVLLSSLQVQNLPVHMSSVVYDIPDFVVTGSFFVGVEMLVNDASPILVDTTSSALRSWIELCVVAGDYAGYTALYTAESFFGLGGNWMIRANGEEVSTVPEPTTIILLGLGLMGLAGIRRKMQ
jgi:hypothetical protein